MWSLDVREPGSLTTGIQRTYLATIHELHEDSVLDGADEAVRKDPRDVGMILDSLKDTAFPHTACGVHLRCAHELRRNKLTAVLIDCFKCASKCTMAKIGRIVYREAPALHP